MPLRSHLLHGGVININGTPKCNGSDNSSARHGGCVARIRLVVPVIHYLIDNQINQPVIAFDTALYVTGYSRPIGAPELIASRKCRLLIGCSIMRLEVGIA